MVVSPTSAQPGTLTSFTYTVTVENMDEEPEGLRKIHDMLPPDFSYKAGTSTGVTTDDPSITVHTGDEDSPPVQQLTWNLATLKITLQPGATTTVSFVAEATAVQGNYCNEAWVEPGEEKTSSGKTARVQVGSPPGTLCGGQAVSVTKTVTPQVAPGDVLNSFTYTIALESAGTDALNLSRVRDLLPPGFLYASSSTTGDLAWGEPTVTMLQGRQRLTWDLAPAFQLDPGQTVSVSFGTEATTPSGDYWNEAWITFDEFTYSIYTGPTARVKLMSVSEATASHGSSTASSEVWLGTDSYLIDRWIISR